MTALSFSVDDPGWIVVTPEVASGNTEDSTVWLEQRAQTVESTWLQAPTPSEKSAVRGAINMARERLTPSDSFVLQYWPGGSILNLLVHLEAGEYDQPRPERVESDAFDTTENPFLPPTVQTVETENLGVGTEARFAERVETREGPIIFVGLHLLFESSYGYVHLTVEPTLPELLMHAAEPLSSLLHSLYVNTEGGKPWPAATVEQDTRSLDDQRWASLG